ncbi:MAG: AmmeMemoRadiSam system protein B [Proteobacteria bacterium]|nr:AmmeMemoRadiSam system protein B [Pseudomonadota bacterium]
MNETAAAVRQPFVAGTFYPADADALREAVAGYVAGGANASPDAPVPKAIIAPHAGFVYSGPVAGSAYARLAPGRGRISRVVLAGPSHRVWFRGIAVPTVAAFETPLGRVPLDLAAIRRLCAHSFVAARDDAHAAEHSLEVHLPFLQQVLGDFALVPMVVGDAAPDEVAAALEAVWGGPETAIVISSDLSHYHPYDSARTLDEATAAAIASLDMDGIAEQGACGRRPIRGLLQVARRRGLRAATIDLRNSGDTAGPRDRVVGYGSFVFEEPRAALGDETRGFLLAAARDAIAAGADGEPGGWTGDAPAEVRRPGASFVTLTAAGKLRGCIGSLAPRGPLIDDVTRNAWRSAYRDPRFPPVPADEVAGLHIGISVLGTPEEMSAQSEAEVISALRPGVDGVILRDQGRQGTFLPQVWETLPDPATFLGRLKGKAGLPQDYWSPTIRLWRYETESFAEPVGSLGESASENEGIAKTLRGSVTEST